MSGGRTHIFSFDMATPSRRNSSHRTRVTASDQEVVNSVIGDSEDASSWTPRVAIRTLQYLIVYCQMLTTMKFLEIFLNLGM